jgi:hypothetical protein
MATSQKVERAPLACCLPCNRPASEDWRQISVRPLASPHRYTLLLALHNTKVALHARPSTMHRSPGGSVSLSTPLWNTLHPPSLPDPSGLTHRTFLRTYQSVPVLNCHLACTRKAFKHSDSKFTLLLETAPSSSTRSMERSTVRATKVHTRSMAPRIAHCKHFDVCLARSVRNRAVVFWACLISPIRQESSRSHGYVWTWSPRSLGSQPCCRPNCLAVRHLVLSRGSLVHLSPGCSRDYACDSTVHVIRFQRDASGKVVIDANGNPGVEFVAIQRKDTGQWAIPGVRPSALPQCSTLSSSKQDPLFPLIIRCMFETQVLCDVVNARVWLTPERLCQSH